MKTILEHEYFPIVLAYLIGMAAMALCFFVIPRVGRWLKRRKLLNGGDWVQKKDVAYGSSPKTVAEEAQSHLERRLREEGIVVRTEVIEEVAEPKPYKEPDVKKSVWLASVPMTEIDDKLINNIVRSLKEQPEDWEFSEYWAKHNKSKLKLYCLARQMPQALSLHYGCRESVNLKNGAHRRMLWEAIKERATEAYNAAQRKKGLGERNAVEAARKAFGGES